MTIPMMDLGCSVVGLTLPVSTCVFKHMLPDLPNVCHHASDALYMTRRAQEELNHSEYNRERARNHISRGHAKAQQLSGSHLQTETLHFPNEHMMRPCRACLGGKGAHELMLRSGICS